MQPRGKICAESEGGVNKICHFLYFLPEIHANTPKNIGKAMVAEQNREKAKRRENGMKSNNQINIPQAREALDKFKMQAASDVDVPITYWKMVKQANKIRIIIADFQKSHIS